jgi:hypothetical protein
MVILWVNYVYMLLFYKLIQSYNFTYGLKRIVFDLSIRRLVIHTSSMKLIDMEWHPSILLHILRSMVVRIWMLLLVSSLAMIYIFYRFATSLPMLNIVLWLCRHSPTCRMHSTHPDFFFSGEVFTFLNCFPSTWVVSHLLGEFFFT